MGTRAMVLRAFQRPLVLEKRVIDEPRGSEVLLRVGAAGVCGTDLKIARGKNRKPTLPRVLGHEFAGEVVAVGPDVCQRAVGDRVAVYMYITCGQCEYCLSGREHLCSHRGGFFGFDRDGGFADYVVVPEANALPIPATMSYADAAILTDAVATSWHAVHSKADVRPTQTVVVVGLGGLGLHAVQCGDVCGGTVIAVDSVPTKLELARDNGARYLVDSGQTDFAPAVLEITDGKGADAVIVFRSRPEIIEAAIKCARLDGTIVMVSYLSAGATVAIDQKWVQGSEVRITGARGNTRQELADVIQLTAAGRLRPLIAERMKLTEVNEALDRLDTGQVNGRLALIP